MHHLPNWEGAAILEKDIDKTKRKVLEALYIAVNKNINQRTGDVKWCMTSAAYTWAERIKRRGGHLGPRTPGSGEIDPT